MIAIGGAIGTGLFLGSATRLHSVGPALVVSYAITGIIAYLLMRALGELVLHRATSGAFVSYMREFFGERWAFITGWMYWLNWALTGIAELSAVALYVQHWWPSFPKPVSVLIGLAVVLVVNLLSAAAFGEFEFWAAIAKVGAIVVFLVVGLVMVIGQFKIGDHRAGISNLWSNAGGFWPSHGGPDLTSSYNWYGPLLVLSGVVFAYAAIELVGVAAGEMKDAATEVPKAVNAVIFRIGVFYCGSILLLACMLPTSVYGTNPKTGDTESPFVTVFGKMGMNWMGDVIQIVLIIAAMSSLNSGLYSTGRVLRSLGMSKEAPKFTLKMSKSGVPWAGIMMTAVVYVFGAVLNLFDASAFETALGATSICILFTWGTIFACQLQLRHLVNKGVIERSPFQMPGHPWTSIIGLAFLGYVLIALAISGWQESTQFWKKTDFLVVVFGLPVIVVLLAIGWTAVRKAVSADRGGQLGPYWTEEGPAPGMDLPKSVLASAERAAGTEGRAEEEES
ncbi:amino acid permease [Flexivirga caeni]|uniref:Amino acid permease n=2 Tax=Flexivirga caeni TaxID=2294115 RepID=A0A3M9M813_9MICO|nr:amino acid permease [Flexivirga caeni]